MACGVHLGILLILLVQAEHVCCLWATQAQSSYRPNSNTYVGFSQQNSGFGGSSPQNQLRLASISLGSAQSSSFNTETAVGDGYGQGLSSSGYAQTLSQPAKSNYASVRLVQSSSVSKPNWQTTKLNERNVQKMPKKQSFGLSSDIASGSSVSKYNKNQSSNKRTLPVQQVPHTSKYLSSSSASIQSPPGESYFKLAYQSAAQKTPAETSAYKSSSLFSAGAPAPHRSPARTKTSASAPARRVSSRRGSEASKPSRFSSLQNERGSQAGAGKAYQSTRFPVNAANAQESYKPTSMSNMASSHVSNSQSLSQYNKQNAPFGFQPRSLKTSTSQRLSYSSTEQIPSSTSSLQTSWNSRNPAQGAHNLPASGSSRAGTSQRFAPTRVHNIPQRFGGFPIRRLKEPADQNEVSVRKPQQTYVAPQKRQPAQQTYVAPQKRQPAQQTYVAPQKQQPAQQTYVAPQKRQQQAPQQQQQLWQPAQQTYVAPQRQAPQQTYVAPKKQQAAQQTYWAPQQQPATDKPPVQSVHQKSEWKRLRLRPNLGQ